MKIKELLEKKGFMKDGVMLPPKSKRYLYFVRKTQANKIYEKDKAKGIIYPWLIVLFLILNSFPASATNISMVNRSINLSSSINYVVTLGDSEIGMTAAQVTFNYDPKFLYVNTVRQGDFLYYAKADSKTFHVFNENSSTIIKQSYRNGKITMISRLWWDYSITQTKKSTLMTINMKPLKKGITIVNLSDPAFIDISFSEKNNQGKKIDGIGKNYTIKIT